jgi:hypothetical protein
MKKISIIIMMLIGTTGCMDNPISINPINEVKPELQIENAVGIKLETLFVKSDVDMNVKSNIAQFATIKIFDIGNNVISKEIVIVNAGNNLLKVYTSALPTSAYRIGLYNAKGDELGITDFNKL